MIKKILIAGLCACALLAISCGTTSTVAENNPQTHSAPNAENNPQITQMDTDDRTQNEPVVSSIQRDTTASETDTQTVGRGGTTEDSLTDDTAQGDEESPLVVREPDDEDFEIIADDDVLKTERADDDDVPLGELAEPTVYDAPIPEPRETPPTSTIPNAQAADTATPAPENAPDTAANSTNGTAVEAQTGAERQNDGGFSADRYDGEVVIDPNAVNTLAETASDAEGTTPIQQPTETQTTPSTQTGANTSNITSTRPLIGGNGASQHAAEPTRPNATQQTAQTTNGTNAGTNTQANTRAQTTTNATPTTASGQTATRSPTATTTTQTANQSAQNTNTAAQSASASDATQPDATTQTEENDALTDAVIPLEKQMVVPSRSVTIKNNQYLDVVYPGSGWVYLGEAEENRDQKKQPIFSYFGRKLGTTDTTFTLRSRKPGTTLLHFYKNDALTGQYIDDYLAVTVETENAKAGVRATAPAYAEVVPPKPSRQTRQSYENVVSTGNEIVGSSPTMTNANTTMTNANTATTNANATATNADATMTNANTATTNADTTAATNAAQTNTATSGTGQNSTAGGTTTENTTSSASTAQSTAVVPVAEDRGVKTVIQTTESAPSGEAKSLATAPAYSGTTNTATNGTTQTTTQGAADESDLDLLEQAKRSYAAKQYETALDQVQRYLDDATSKIDEALFLQGQILEAESSVKSIRSAIDSYESLTKNYPMSSLWGKANNRIIYLKRFYIEIR